MFELGVSGHDKDSGKCFVVHVVRKSVGMARLVAVESTEIAGSGMVESL